MGEATVWLQALDGRWEAAGRDRFPGAIPESVQVTSDPGGFAVCSFQMHRPDLWLPAADLTAWTPCEIDEGEARLFEGRVQETPIGAGDGIISVAGRGWQYAKDDDALQPMHLATDLAMFQDTRGLPGYRAEYIQAGRVEAGAGGITFGWAKDLTVPASSFVGVTADFGDIYDQEAIPTALAIQYDTFAAWSGFTVYARAHDDLAHTNVNDYLATTMTAGLQTRMAFITPRRRYLSLFLFNAAQQGPVASDTLVRIRRISLSKDRDAIGSQGRSYVRASDIIRHAVEHGALKLGIDALDTPNLFGDEAAALAATRWWRPGGGGATIDQSGSSSEELGAVGAPIYQASGGPLDSGEPSTYMTLTGDDALGTGITD